jgi:hypothetical protein
MRSLGAFISPSGTEEVDDAKAESNESTAIRNMIVYVGSLAMMVSVENALLLTGNAFANVLLSMGNAAMQKRHSRLVCESGR